MGSVPSPRRSTINHMELTLNWYLSLSAVLFTIGVLGVLLRRNAIVILRAGGLVLNAVTLELVALGQSFGDGDGQIVVFCVMGGAAAEAAVGLAIGNALYPNNLPANVD